ncbi:MAG TPA: hypothetical protein PLU53_08055 [Bacteroidia bacterium]|nr:hypothetical protein [Bacteroidia bacterium]
MKPHKTKKKQNYEKEYNQLMTGFQPSLPSQNSPQWINTGDFIAKFSLYKESPNSISSTDTSVTTAF